MEITPYHVPFIFLFNYIASWQDVNPPVAASLLIKTHFSKARYGNDASHGGDRAL